MKQQLEYLATFLWFKEEIHDPYQTIPEFFSATDVVSHKTTIKTAISAAFSDYSCNKKESARFTLRFQTIGIGG